MCKAFSSPPSCFLDQEEMLWDGYAERGSGEEEAGRGPEVGSGRCEYIQCGPPSLLPPDTPRALASTTTPPRLLALLEQSSPLLASCLERLYLFEKTGIRTTCMALVHFCTLPDWGGGVSSVEVNMSVQQCR